MVKFEDFISILKENEIFLDDSDIKRL